jgi:hypothetical protein
MRLVVASRLDGAEERPQRHIQAANCDVTLSTEQSGILTTRFFFDLGRLFVRSHDYVRFCDTGPSFALTLYKSHGPEQRSGRL